MHITRNLSNLYTREIQIVTIIRRRFIQGDSGEKVNILGSESIGQRGGEFGYGTALQTEGSRVRFPIVSLKFFIDIILPASTQPLTMSTKG
jgi:hypothetical protein